MSEKICLSHHEKLVSFCISPFCQLKPLCSLCIVQHLKEIHSSSSAFGDIELLNLELFYNKCKEKIEKSKPKYEIFLEEVKLSHSPEKQNYEKIIDRINFVKNQIIDEITKTFNNHLNQYREFYEKQSQQIIQKLLNFNENVSLHYGYLSQVLQKCQDNEQSFSNLDFSFLQKVYTDSLDLELEKKKNTLSKLMIELQHINLMNANVDKLIETNLKALGKSLDDFLSKIFVKTTANTSLVGIPQIRSMKDLRRLPESTTSLYRESRRIETTSSSDFEKGFIGNNRSCSNLLSLKTEEAENENIWKKRSHTPNIPKFKKNQEEKESIEELIEEENRIRSSFSEKKTSIILNIKKKNPNENSSIKKEKLKAYFPSRNPCDKNKMPEILPQKKITCEIFLSPNKKTNEIRSPQKHQAKNHYTHPKNNDTPCIKDIFPEKNFLNYLLFLRNLSYKKYNIFLITQEFTRRIASMKNQESCLKLNLEILNEFQLKLKEINGLKQRPKELGLIFQDYSGDYFFWGMNFEFSKNMQGYYLIFNEESQEKIEKFRSFINGYKLLLSIFLKEDVEIRLKEVRYELGMPKQADLIRIAICYHIQSRRESFYRRDLSIEDLLEFKKKYIS